MQPTLQLSEADATRRRREVLAQQRIEREIQRGEVLPAQSSASASPSFFESGINYLESATGLDIDFDGDVGVVGPPPPPLPHTPYVHISMGGRKRWAEAEQAHVHDPIDYVEPREHGQLHELKPLLLTPEYANLRSVGYLPPVQAGFTPPPEAYLPEHMLIEGGERVAGDYSHPPVSARSHDPSPSPRHAQRREREEKPADFHGSPVRPRRSRSPISTARRQSEEGDDDDDDDDDGGFWGGLNSLLASFEKSMTRFFSGRPYVVIDDAPAPHHGAAHGPAELASGEPASPSSPPKLSPKTASPFHKHARGELSPQSPPRTPKSPLSRRPTPRTPKVSPACQQRR